MTTKQTQTITEFLESGGYGFRRDGDSLHLTGEWVHDWPAFVLDADATVERIGGDVYHVTDSSGTYRIEVFECGANGAITEI